MEQSNGCFSKNSEQFKYGHAVRNFDPCSGEGVVSLNMSYFLHYITKGMLLLCSTSY